MSSLPRPALDIGSIEQSLQTLQERIDQLSANLAQQQKLATLGMVTAVIAHEFNNILTPMISYTRYALSEKGDEELKMKALEKCLSGAERAAMISNSLLGFTSNDATTTANIKKAIQDTMGCLSRDLGKDGITLTVNVPEELGAAISQGHLQQVLMNLVVNARSAMLGRQGGVKRLTITAAVVKKNKIVQLKLADTGPGIDPKVLPKIFDPFFSTKGQPAQMPTGTAANHLDEVLPKGGTGLGLTICQDLIQSAGGTMAVESVQGQGATFVIELPVGGEVEKSVNR